MELRQKCPICKQKEWKWLLKHREYFVPKLNQVITSVDKMCRKCSKKTNNIIKLT